MRCPTGIATQDPKRWQALDVPDKATRLFQFHQNTVHALRDLLCAAGLEHPDQIDPEQVLQRVSPIEVRSLAALYRFLDPGELMTGIPNMPSSRPSGNGPGAVRPRRAKTLCCKRG